MNRVEVNNNKGMIHVVSLNDKIRVAFSLYLLRDLFFLFENKKEHCPSNIS